jgi:D-threo-aldose 1-dehydrogenase
VTGRLPAFGLGTVPLGNYRSAITDEAAARFVAAAWERGVRYFDTAPLYGSGLAERRLGLVLPGLPRDELRVSTKVGRRLDANAPPDPTLLDHGRPIYIDVPALNPVPDFTADGVRRSLEGSLRRLGLDRVDVVYLHDPQGHERAALNEALPALLALRGEGVVGAVGVGTTDVACVERMVRAGGLDVVMLASRVTLLDRSGVPAVTACRDHGVAVAAAGVFNSGLLADPRPDSAFHYRTVDPGTLTTALRMRDVCEAAGTSLRAAAVQFPLRLAGVGSVVVGAQTEDELDDDLAAAAAPVPDHVWAELDAVARSGRRG